MYTILLSSEAIFLIPNYLIKFYLQSFQTFNEAFFMHAKKKLILITFKEIEKMLIIENMYSSQCTLLFKSLGFVLYTLII